MSTALYRRYRPETFADVIGQEHVTEPLMQALRTGRVNHAYLFSGPRGCGKTTSARILARCLNCEQGPTPTPCGVCDSCVALARGGPGSVDVIEIDAASHGGVDDARDLRERASFGPANSRYKVYIIDEAHMVTPQGFNALLKIVEEPPEHVKFIFATTEPEKVIGTIRSRTHHYPFRLVPPQKLTDYMEQLLAAENVPSERGVLSFVTRAGGGSVRDSLSVLDQLIAGSGPEGLTYAGASALLGFTDEELLDGIVDAFASADAAAVFRQIDKVIESGADPRRFIEDLLERLRDLIIVAAVAEGAGAVLRGTPQDQLERMRQQAAAFGPGALSRAADVINAGLTEMTGATSPRLQLELMCARVLLPGIAGLDGYAARLDRMERRLDMGEMPPRSAHGQGGSAPEIAAPRAAGEAPQHSAVSPASASVQQDDEPQATRPAGPSQGDGRNGALQSSEAQQPGGEIRVEETTVKSDLSTDSPVNNEYSATTANETSHFYDKPTVAQEGARQESSTAPQPTQSMAPETAAAPASRAPGGLTTDDIRRAWPDVLDRIFRIKRVTWTLLSQNAHVVDFDGNRIVLGASSPGLANTMSRGQHPEVVRQALIEAIGVDVRVEARPLEAGESAPGGQPAPSGFSNAASSAPADAGWGDSAPTQRARPSDPRDGGGASSGNSQASSGARAPLGDQPVVETPREAEHVEQDAGLASAAAQSRSWANSSEGDWGNVGAGAPEWASSSDDAAPAWATSADEPTPAWMEDEPETDVEAVYDPLPEKPQSENRPQPLGDEAAPAFDAQAAAAGDSSAVADVPATPQPTEGDLTEGRHLTPRQRAEKAAREAAQHEEDARRGGPRFDDTAVSPDDEDIENSDAVGLPVIKSVLGGTVIKEEGPESGA